MNGTLSTSVEASQIFDFRSADFIFGVAKHNRCLSIASLSSTYFWFTFSLTSSTLTWSCTFPCQFTSKVIFMAHSVCRGVDFETRDIRTLLQECTFRCLCVLPVSYCPLMVLYCSYCNRFFVVLVWFSWCITTRTHRSGLSSAYPHLFNAVTALAMGRHYPVFFSENMYPFRPVHLVCFSVWIRTLDFGTGSQPLSFTLH